MKASDSGDTTPPGGSRRHFLDWFLGRSATAVLGSILHPILRFVSPPRIPEAQTNEVEVGRVNDPEFLAKQFKIVRFGNDPVIVIKLSDDEFRAFSAVCTHLGCIVDYRVDRRLIWCWCHNGIYDLTGKNIGGPPPRPLTPFEVVLDSSAGRPERVIVRRV